MAMRHSVVLDVKRCRGCTTCIKCCPTEAIRVRGRRATILPDRCIDYISVDNRHKKSTALKTFEVIDERMASDHRPIVADIELK